jgi:hypothetical protein
VGQTGDEAQRYRELAKLCRERADERSRKWERMALLGAAEEFERLAQDEEGRSRVDAP